MGTGIICHRVVDTPEETKICPSLDKAIFRMFGRLSYPNGTSENPAFVGEDYLSSVRETELWEGHVIGDGTSSFESVRCRADLDRHFENARIPCCAPLCTRTASN